MLGMLLDVMKMLTMLRQLALVNAAAFVTMLNHMFNLNLNVISSLMLISETNPCAG